MLLLTNLITTLRNCITLMFIMKSKAYTRRFNATLKSLFLIVVSFLLFNSYSFADDTANDNTHVKQQNKAGENKEIISPIENKSTCDGDDFTMTFNPKTIFDESEEGITFLHRWANALHIDTKVITLENDATFFMEKCVKTQADLEELERHLRSRKYLRDAKVTSEKELEHVTVTTWDNWSLMPTISFGRKGGVNTYSVGIKERNLLGLGINTEISAYQNTQRSGYKLIADIPLFQKQNTSVNLRFADNDDGEQHHIFYKKVFAGFHTKTAYDIGFNEESRNDTIFQNGQNQSIFAHEISYKRASYAWLDFNNYNRLLRYRVGFTQDDHLFSSLANDINDESDNSVLTSALPENRELLYPWLGIEYIEKDFKKLSNIHLISQIEDFNHGWQISSQFGIGNGKHQNTPWSVWNMRVQKGFNLHDKALLLLDLSLANDNYQHRDSRLLIKVSGEYFYQLTPRWGFYLSNVNVSSQNQYLDKPVTIGGNTGLRGFPLQYQHGENSIKFTSELRYYPSINLFKIFDVAGVAFIDAARAFGETTVENIEKNWLGSMGLGLRVYSPHSAGSNSVIHIDFALPQSNNPEIDSFEIRVQAKKAF